MPRAHTLPAPGSFRAWVLAIRPPTLTAAVVPVAVGAGVAIRDGYWAPLAALAALVGALALQIGANFANDLSDFRRGADTEDRLGPPRATQLGIVTRIRPHDAFRLPSGMKWSVSRSQSKRRWNPCARR